MLVKCLIDNISENPTLVSEHGLSLYIEGHGHKILFDTGQSGAFMDNAVTLGVDLEAVDTVVVSHGHYDHGGGLSSFLDLNKRAIVYMSKMAFGDYYSERMDDSKKYIGLDRGLMGHERIRYVDQRQRINECLEVFTNTSMIRPMPMINKYLYEKKAGVFVPDLFAHEINLKMTCGGKSILVAGCAHNGIENIVETYKMCEGAYPNVVIGGFHLSSGSRGISVCEKDIRNIGVNLLKSKSVYYTCHCTGMSAFQVLKEEMGNQICYLSAGRSLHI